MSTQTTVAIPFQNHARWIGDTLDSALAQSDPPALIIAVNDRSSDDSEEIVLSRRSSTSIPIEVIRLKERVGPMAGREIALQRTRTDYLIFLDADDVLDPRKIRVDEEILNRHPDVAVSAGPVVDFWDEDPARKIERPVRLRGIIDSIDLFTKHIMDWDMIVTPGAATIRTSFLRDRMRNWPDLDGVQDQMLWGFLAMEFPFYFHDQAPLRYRHRADSHSARLATSTVHRAFLPYYLLLWKHLDMLHPSPLSVERKARRYVLQTAMLERLYFLSQCSGPLWKWRMRYLEEAWPIFRQLGLIDSFFAWQGADPRFCTPQAREERTRELPGERRWNQEKG